MSVMRTMASVLRLVSMMWDHSIVNASLVTCWMRVALTVMVILDINT